MVLAINKCTILLQSPRRLTLRSQGDAPPSQGSTTCTPTMNSTTGGHKARELGLRQAWAPALQIRRSAKADRARQKARAQTDGCRPTPITLELCGYPFRYGNNGDPYIYEFLTAPVLGGTNSSSEAGLLRALPRRQSHIRASSLFWRFTHYSL